MNTGKNRLYAKYGHECEITSSWEDLPMFQASSNILTEIGRLFVRFRMASELNKLGNMFLRSQKALEMEHRKHMKHLYIVHPFSIARKWWETFMIFILAVVFASIPLDLASFECPLRSNLNNKILWKWIRLIFDLCCCGDVIMNFFTGYCDTIKKEVILDPKKIAGRYVLTYFVPDFLSSIPTHMDLIIPFGHSDHFRTIMRFFQYSGCLKLLRCITFYRYCKRFGDIFDVNFGLHRVSLAIFCYFMYFHVITCINIVIFGFMIKANFEIGEGPGDYFDYKNSQNETVEFIKIYFQIFFRTVHLVSHSGTEIEIDKTLLNKIYVMLLWCLSKLIFFYLISQLMDVVMSVRSSRNKYKEMVRQLREYMRHKQLPESLQRRLIGYYEFRFQKSYFRESEIVHTISGQLQQEIVMHSCRRLVENVDFFKNLPLPLIIRIVSALSTDIYLINDVIIKFKTKGDCMYFIASGCVAIYTKTGREVCHLDDGHYFGEIAMLQDNGIREASVVAVEVSELYRLDRSEFVKAILPYPDLMQKIKKKAFERLEATQFIDERNVRERSAY